LVYKTIKGRKEHYMLKTKKRKIIWSIICVFVIVIVVCTIRYGTKDVSYEEVNVEIDGSIFTFTKQDTNFDKELTMLDSKQLKITNHSRFDIYVNSKRIKPKKSIQLKDISITEDETIDIKVKFEKKDAYTTYIFKTLPSDFPEYETQGASQYKGEYYFNINNGLYTYLVKINEKGAISFYKKLSIRTYDFKKVYNKAGKVRYTYLDMHYVIEDGLVLLCDFVVLDENYQEIDRVTYKEANEKQMGIDRHDSLYIDDGHYIWATQKEKVVDNMPEELGYGSTMKVCNCILQEVKDGTVIWEFNSIEYPELYTYYEKTGVTEMQVTDTYYNDYMHFNSFAIDKQDGNLICSFRNIDSIIKINRTTGKLIWVLGGKGDQFGLTEEQKFSKQHSISFLENHAILIYDNGAKKEESRIVQIKINEETKKVETYIQYALDVFSSSTGSVQAIDESKNIYVVCYGGGTYRGKANVEEKNLKTGETYFTLSLKDISIDAIKKIK